MPLPAFSEIDAHEARAVCAKTFLDDSIQALAEPSMTPPQFLERLLEDRRYTEAVHFLAHGLPTAHAIRWAYLSVASMAQGEPEPDPASGSDQGEPTDDASEAPPRPPLVIAERWLEEVALGSASEEERIEALREEAGRAAQALAGSTAAAWIAAAVAQSGPPEEGVDPALHEKIVPSHAAAAILLAAGEGPETIVEDHDDQYLRYLQSFLAHGVSIATGGASSPAPATLDLYFPRGRGHGRVKARVDSLEDLADLSADDPNRGER